MKEYELWLDESGSFENDKKEVSRKMNPSLIGGILFIKKEFSASQATSLIGERVIHSNEENKNDVFEKFKCIAGKKVTLVEISNNECITVMDSNLTYQNIMAEGLIQIITKLKEKNGNHNFRLDILIAQRGDCTSENKSHKPVSVEQYVNRIQERMLLEGYHKNIPVNCWTIQIADAKKDQRLMIADIICNSFLTRDTKFKGEQGEYINSIRDNVEKTWKFSVFETSIDKSIKRLLLEGRLGEAVVSLCQSENEEFIKNKFGELSEYMKNMDYDDMHLQFKIVSSRITYYVKIEREYGNCIKLLEHMIEFWIPCIENLPQQWGHEIANVIKLDLLIHKYTIYTHQGDLIHIQECEKICEELFSNQGKMNVDALEYLLMYNNRKIMHKINLFDFETALADSNKLVNRCETIKEAINISEEDIKFNELAKALGTRAQIYMYRIRRDIGAYEYAQGDVKAAIEEFSSESDIQRQHIYLTQIHSEAGQFDEALKTLCGNETELKQWLEKSEYFLFSISAYVRLMAEGKLEGWELADKMYCELNKTQIITNIRASQNYYHPREIIFWKLGTYYANCSKSQNAALEYYKEALKCYEQNSLTLDVIGFAVELERYAFALKEKYSEAKSFQRALKKHYEKLEGENVPESIRAIYSDIDFEKDDWKYFYEISRRVTY